MHLPCCRWPWWFVEIFKESCLCKQHSAGSCVYPSRTVEVKASRGEFWYKLRHWPPGTSTPKCSCRLFCLLTGFAYTDHHADCFAHSFHRAGYAWRVGPVGPPQRRRAGIPHSAACSRSQASADLERGAATRRGRYAALAISGLCAGRPGSTGAVSVALQLPLRPCTGSCQPAQLLL